MDGKAKMNGYKLQSLSASYITILWDHQTACYEVFFSQSYPAILMKLNQRKSLKNQKERATFFGMGVIYSQPNSSSPKLALTYVMPQWKVQITWCIL